MELTAPQDSTEAPVALASIRAGEGPPLVIVHGSGTDRSRWSPVLPYLVDHFTVYAVDRRGHGESADQLPYCIEAEFADVTAFLSHIADDRTIVVAHSYGAVCALGAVAQGARAARLVLYEPPLPASPDAYCPPGLIETMRDELGRGDRDAAVTAFARAIFGLNEAEIARRRRLGLWEPMVAAAPIILRELESVARCAMQAARFAACRVPTLLLVGAESPPEYHATAEALGAVLPDCRIRRLPGQGHRAIDTAPELLAAAVLDFAGQELPPIQAN